MTYLILYVYFIIKLFKLLAPPLANCYICLYYISLSLSYSAPVSICKIELISASQICLFLPHCKQHIVQCLAYY